VTNLKDMQSQISILSFFWQHIKPYKWFYLVMLIAPMVGSFYPFAYNYAIKLFVDTMVEKPSVHYSDFAGPLMLYLGAHLVLNIAWRIGDIAEWKSEPYVRRSILSSSYDYVQHHSYGFFQENFTGALSSRIKGILDGYDNFWGEIHHGFFAKFFSIIVNFAALAWLNVNLGIFIFAWGVFYISLMTRLSVKLNKLSFEETESCYLRIREISDKIMNIISLFSFSGRKRELNNLYHQITSDFVPKQIKVYRYYFKMQVLMGILFILMFSFLLLYMVYLRIHGMVSIGDFSFVFGIALVIADDIWHVTLSMQDFSRNMGDLMSALTIVSIPHQNLDKENAIPLVIKSPTVEFRGLSFSYSEKESFFQDLNLTIKAGEKIGLVGASGAGKSSLVNVLLRYFPYKEGDIFIGGENIKDVTQDSLREQIAVIPQDTLLFHRTLMENIRYGKPEATDKEVIKASKKAHLHEDIITLPHQYNTEVGERGVKLSGGQRQRVAIARAILKDAPILVLDEATSALDSHTEQLIQESLDFLMNDKKKTVIAIAHRLSTLKHADRIIVLEKGKIVEEGDHVTLIADPKSVYKRLWELQQI